MNRTIFAIAATFSGSTLLLIDSALKGTALLAAAGVAALALRRDSAATRHLVWLLAMVALLVVPVLSALLPQWRVLPEWTGIAPASAAKTATTPVELRTVEVAADVVQRADPTELEQPVAMLDLPAAEPTAAAPAPQAFPQSSPPPPVNRWRWPDVLPLVWAIGFAALVLRLIAARLVLWSIQRHASVIPSTGPAAIEDPIACAVEAARMQLGVRPPVTLLIHPDKTVPIVWGIFRCRLLLPAAARQWSSEQLRSVVLHELAHIKRRDTAVQPLAQLACALHWFNPLVWLADRRLGVERERACDDLVLASGVRPSAYATHLLDVVTGLSPARRTPACGLAMARTSSLEGRLRAVLSENRNRRSVSLALAAIALAVAAGIAVPIAMLRAEQAPDAPQQSQEPRQSPEAAADLPAAQNAHAHLQWGEPVDGLRAAVAIRTPPDERQAASAPDIFLAIQNVTDAPIRLVTGATAPNPRYLKIKSDGVTQVGMTADQPTELDALLQPREVVFLRLFASEPAVPDGRTAGALIADDVLAIDRLTVVAEMTIEQAPAGAWTGKLVTGETTGAAASGKFQPRDKEAQALFKSWQDSARTDGMIPGGALRSLANVVENFIRLNPTHERVPRLTELLERIDTSRDWTQADAVVLLDDLTAIYASLPEWAMSPHARRLSIGAPIRAGQPLPDELSNAAWGPPAANGLRAAWWLEPRAEQYPLGTNLESRVLFHNSGRDTVVFRTPAWHQYSTHQARDGEGAEIAVTSTYWTTLVSLVTIRLTPGEYAEVDAHGIAVGARNADEESWSRLRVGAWIEAKEGDAVTFRPADVVASGDLFTMPAERMTPGEMWEAIVKERIAREAPMPATAADREQLIRRVMPDLLGVPPTEEEVSRFVADDSPDALAALAARIIPRVAPFAGDLPVGEITFRVTAAAPDAANRPRVETLFTESRPGRYVLGETARLVVVRRPEGKRIVNEARIEFASSDSALPAPGKAYELRLPDGYDTWSAVWIRGTGVLWVRHSGRLHSYDFTNPADVRETTLADPADREKVPQAILDALPPVPSAAPAAPASAR